MFVQVLAYYKHEKGKASREMFVFCTNSVMYIVFLCYHNEYLGFKLVIDCILFYFILFVL